MFIKNSVCTFELLLIKISVMKIYSIQQKQFIEAELYASSEFWPQDDRTCQGYYIDANGLIHSQSLNYSILFTRPVTIKEFKERVKASTDYHKITFISN